MAEAGFAATTGLAVPNVGGGAFKLLVLGGYAEDTASFVASTGLSVQNAGGCALKLLVLGQYAEDTYFIYSRIFILT